MLGAIKRRYKLVRAYLSPRRDFPIAIDELVVGLLKPSNAQLGRKYVADTREEDGYLVAKIRGATAPMYWPKELSILDLYRVTAECFDESNWQFYEVPETQVRSGDIVLDCGGAEGIFALRVLGRAGHVYVFEPSPVFARSMERTFARHDNVTIVPKALGDQPGTAFLAGSSLYGTVNDGGAGVPIEITTIDAWAAETGSRVDYIKVDVEGFESSLFAGATDTIRRYRPTIATSVYHEGNDWRSILSFLRDLVPEYQYRVRGLFAKGSRPRPVLLHLWVGDRSRMS